MAHILLADDNADLLAALVDILQRAGHTVAIAANGKEALTLVKASHFDLVITDLVMPEKEGLETIWELHRQIPTMKIIAMSGGGRTDPKNNLLMAQQFGAARTLQKPFTGSQLVEEVNLVLQPPA